MWLDRISNPGPLVLESDALPIVLRGPAFPTNGKLCQPNSKWVSFSNQGKIMQGKERDGLRLSSAVMWARPPAPPPPPHGC